MIRCVYERVAKVLPTDVIWVATDDERIARAVRTFGGQVVMTSPTHRSGTDRCGEALEKIGGDFDVVINVQGDEPFVYPEQLRTLMACFTDTTEQAGEEVQIATLVKPIGTGEEAMKTLFNPNVPKVVLNSGVMPSIFRDRLSPTSAGKNQPNGRRYTPITDTSGYMPIVATFCANWCSCPSACWKRQRALSNSVG